jgi:hypothetical protein
LRLRLLEFNIPDLPRGMLLATFFFAVAWLTAFPDVPYAWVWGLIIGAGIVTWVMGSGWIRPRDASQTVQPPSGLDKPHRPSADFAALIDAITAQGQANRQEEQSEDRAKTFREWLTIPLLIGTVILLRYQVEEMKKVYDPIKGQADAAIIQAEAAKTQGAVAKTQADAAIEMAKAARENTVAAERAWVGPNGATMDAVPVAGSEASFVINCQNSGRQPAISFQSNAQPFVLTLEEDKNGGFISETIKNTNDCLARGPVSGAQVVYPSTGFSGNQLTVKFDKDLIDGNVAIGAKIIGVTGCFVYETFGTPHHSTFCFFYRNGVTKVPNMNFCSSGAYAD